MAYTSIHNTPAWRALLDHAETLKRVSLNELFAEDPQRGSRFRATCDPVYFDYAKDHITDRTLTLLLDLANTANLSAAIEALFCGQPVNTTEHRPALHTALRSRPLGDSEAERSTAASLHKITTFAEKVRQREDTGATGKPFCSIVNLGIGGSDLGPRLVVNAFSQRHHAAIRSHFVANIDSDALSAALAECTADTTLFVISSKSFSTIETLANADRARRWLLEAGIAEDGLGRHFVAATANGEAAQQWGVPAQRVFAVEEWVGGRFSLWSAVGLPIALALGNDVFRQLLDGARSMDEHFRSADFADNLPVLHGLQAIWHINFRGHEKTGRKNNNGYHSRAVIPYVHQLRLLPSYLQQLMMESLGKSTVREGLETATATGQVIWGDEGTNGQHSFHQFLLQGTEVVPVDFIATRTPHCQADAHRQLIANCLAQSSALMTGKTVGEAYAELIAQGFTQTEAHQLAAHKSVPGNRPSNTIVLDDFSPRSLGALLAFYEHSVYVQSVIWNINAFDQWGVEFGKQISDHLFTALGEPETPAPILDRLDSSTRNLLDHFCNDSGAQKKS